MKIQYANYNCIILFNMLPMATGLELGKQLDDLFHLVDHSSRRQST